VRSCYMTDAFASDWGEMSKMGIYRAASEGLERDISSI